MSKRKIIKQRNPKREFCEWVSEEIKVEELSYPNWKVALTCGKRKFRNHFGTLPAICPVCSCENAIFYKWSNFFSIYCKRCGYAGMMLHNDEKDCLDYYERIVLETTFRWEKIG